MISASTPITATVSNFCRITGIGRSKTYELLAARLLDSIKIGNRRLIVIDSYRKLIEEQRSGPKHHPQPGLGADQKALADENGGQIRSENQEIPPTSTPLAGKVLVNSTAEDARKKIKKFSGIDGAGQDAPDAVAARHGEAL